MKITRRRVIFTHQPAHLQPENRIFA